MFCTGRQDTPQETLRGVLLYGPLESWLLHFHCPFPGGEGAGVSGA